MKIHSDILQSSDLHAALSDANIPAVYLDECNARGSRSRRGAFEFRLAAVRGPGHHRRRNSGQYGAEGADVAAATYADHGKWMAELFKRDADAIVGPYKGVDDFHRATKGEFA